MSSSAEPAPPAGGPYPQWVRDVRAPVPLPPPNSCDCQAHLFGDPGKYPAGPEAVYTAPDATFADLQKVERVLGFERVVFVHSQIYGPDHRLLLDILEGLADRSPYRAIGRVDETTSDAELARLDAAGFRGTRLTFHPNLRQPPSWQVVARIIDRIKVLGWHLRLHVGTDVVLEYSDRFHAIKNLPVVIDHLGYVDTTRGRDQPACRWICDQLESGNWWVMISNGNRLSPMERGWDDAIPIARAFIEAAPDRIIWGSDWPHVQWRKRMMNDAEEVELLYRYVDHDRALLQKILVDNPARLHGFV